MLGVEADSFVPVSYGEVQPGNYWETSVDWKWTDAAVAPVTEESYFGHLVALVSGKQTIEVLTVDEENHTIKQLRTQNLTYTAMGSEKPAAIAYAGQTEYESESGDKVPALSMTMVEVDGAAGLLIADAFKGAADLYYVELGEELTCEKVGRLAGALGISALYTDADLAGEESDEETAEDAAEANSQIRGSLNSIEVEASNKKEHTGGVVVDSEKRTVTVNVTASDSTNGLFDLNYDAEVLTLQSVKSMYLNSFVVSEGSVTFAYAD